MRYSGARTSMSDVETFSAAATIDLPPSKHRLLLGDSHGMLDVEQTARSAHLVRHYALRTAQASTP